MEKGLQKYSVSELKLGAKTVAFSLLLEAVILAPGKTISLPKGKQVTVRGLLPLLQPQIATAGRFLLNEALPSAMTFGDKVLQKTKVYSFAKGKVLDLVYIKADRYSLNDLLTKFFEKATFLDRNQFTSAFRDWAYSVLNSEEDRETFVNNLTDNIISGLRALVSGPVASVLVSSHLLKVIEETVENVVEKFMSTEFGNEMVNRLFDAIEHLEDMTLPYFLDTKMNLPRPIAEQKTDDLYDRYIGKGRVESYLEKGYGDQLYHFLRSVDYESIWQEIRRKHLKELIQISFGAAGTAIYVSGEMGRASKRVDKIKEHKRKLSAKKAAAKEKLQSKKNSGQRKITNKERPRSKNTTSQKKRNAEVEL